MTGTGLPREAAAIKALLGLVGDARWAARIAAIRAEGSGRSGQVVRQRHAIELTLEQLRVWPARPLTPAERCIAAIAAAITAEARRLSPAGRERLRAALAEALVGERSLIGLFHLFRTAMLQRARGFAVHFAGLEDGASFDLLLRREDVEAEVVCDVVSAEEGRDLHRGAFFSLADRIDPDLQTWLAAHPGRYLLKMTLPQGLRASPDNAAVLGLLHQRIRGMLSGRQRADHDETAVLRLDPLMLAAAQADELGLLSSLRREFGPEAHLAVTASGGGVFVMAARAGRENEVAVAVRRRMAALAPARLSGARPGILAMFIEDTDRAEWRGLRERLELEGEARHFLTHPEARPVVAVTCASRLEMFGMTAPDAAPDGEFRFRNPSHPAAKNAALAPAVVSSV